jgi:hypothetical protein
MQNLLPEKLSTQVILQLSREELVGIVINQEQVIEFWILDFRLKTLVVLLVHNNRSESLNPTRIVSGSA